MVYQGPIQPGTSEETFRKTGKSVPVYQGPQLPGYEFTSTGGSRPIGSRGDDGGTSGMSPRFRKAYEAEQRAAAEAEVKRQATLKTPQTNLATSYRTSHGTISAQAFAEQNRQKAVSRVQNIQAHQGYKTAESKYLGDVQKRSYENYLKAGMSSAQARYMAEQWKKRQEQQIKASGGFTITTEVPSTATEQSVFPAMEKTPENILQKGYGYYTGAEEYTAQRTTIPAFDFIERKTGFDITSVKFQNLFGFSFLGVGNIGFKPSAERDVVAGISSDTLKDVKYKPLKQIGLYGVASGAGFVTRGAVTGISRLSPTAGTVANIGLTTGGIILTGAYAYDVGSKIYPQIKTGDYAAAGGTFGVAAKDFYIIGAGFKAGSKGFDITKGLYQTKGRKFIDIPQGDYPSAPPRKQLKLFQKNIYPELGEKPGAFHTTGKTFWESGTITPTKGSSELPGLYGSTKISAPFSRITGSSSTTKFNLKNWINNLFSVSGKPGVAYLQPEGFRYSSAKPGKWYSPAKSGYADVPGIKTEIEAIFRPEAGGYQVSSKGYYTKIKGVRVPIDSFVYDKSIILAAGDIGINLAGGQGSYYGYTSPSYKPFIFSVSAATTSTAPSSVSITPSYSSASSFIPSVSSIVSKPSGRSYPKSYAPSYTPKITSIVPSMSSVVTSSKSSSRSASKIYSSILPSSIRKSYTSSYRYYPKKPPKSPPIFMKGLKLPRQTFGKFPVYARRFGKWKSIGFGTTKEQALLMGKQYSQKTLGRSFYVPGVKPQQILPGFRTKIEKGKGLIYIQKTGKGAVSTLGSSTEKKEIQFYRGLKIPKMKSLKINRVKHKRKK